MVFSSISFLTFFLPCLFACYFVIPRKFRSARNGVLLVFSLVFYACGGPKFLLLMLLSIAVNYICGLFASAQHTRPVRLAGMMSAIIIGIGLLGYFKYAGFFAEIINSMGVMVPVPEITLPIGISFYTFQGLSYVIDVYRNDARVQRNPFKIALYIALFPQLVPGPIVRYTTVETEISERREYRGGFRGDRPVSVRSGEKNDSGQQYGGDCGRRFFSERRRSFGGFRLAWSLGVYRSDLFRFFRLFRYGHRSGKNLRISFPGKLRLSIYF